MIKIISYSKEYKDDVVHLILDIYENELGFTGFDRPDIYNISKVYQNNTNSNFWVALSSGKLVGTIGLEKKTIDLAYLRRMVVKKEFRKQGLGKELLHTALVFAKAQGFKTIYAGTVKENPGAIKFYKNQRFTQTDDVPEDITASSNSICLQLSL